MTWRAAGERRPLWCVLAPFSEAQSNTLKYCPTFSDRFGSPEDARRFGRVLFPWHNDEHHHSGLVFLPARGAAWVSLGSCGRRRGSQEIASDQWAVSRDRV